MKAFWISVRMKTVCGQLETLQLVEAAMRALPFNLGSWQQIGMVRLQAAIHHESS